jgi:hypothetical protein
VVRIRRTSHALLKATTPAFICRKPEVLRFRADRERGVAMWRLLLFWFSGAKKKKNKFDFCLWAHWGYGVIPPYNLQLHDSSKLHICHLCDTARCDSLTSNYTTENEVFDAQKSQGWIKIPHYYQTTYPPGMHEHAVYQPSPKFVGVQGFGTTGFRDWHQY